MRRWKSFCVRTLHWKVLPCVEPAGQGNDFELISTVRMESQDSIGAPTCRDFPRFIIVSDKSRLEVGNRWRWSRFFKKDHLRANFQKIIPKSFTTSQNHVLCANFVKFGWPEIDKVVRCLPSARSPALASARIAPKICQRQLQAIYSEFPEFHPNTFTSGVVIAERVNVVETRHKVFPILGEASSPSNNDYTSSVVLWFRAQASVAYMYDTTTSHQLILLT